MKGMTENPITIQQALEYEVHSMRWLGFVSWKWLQHKLAKIIVWRLKRKFARYMQSVEFERKMRILNPELFR